MKTAYEYSKELIGDVKPCMSFNGGDFEEWRTAAREKLSELLGLDKFKKCSPDLEIEYNREIEGATEIRFTFQSEEGYRVPCHLMLPKGVDMPPVIITLQGHSKGMHISLGRPKFPGDENSINGGDRDFCVRAVKEGFAAIAMEQRNFGECGGNETGPQCFESSMTALLMGRTTVAERVWDVMSLIDVLKQSFADKVDTLSISLMGNSGGGTATAYTAALEDRIVLAMPSCAVCTFKDSIGAMNHCACNYVPHIAEYFDMGDLIAMAAPKYYIQVNGIEDEIFPLFGAEAMFAQGEFAYKSVEAQDRIVHVKGNGGHRFYADDTWPIIHKFLQK